MTTQQLESQVDSTNEHSPPPGTGSDGPGGSGGGSPAPSAPSTPGKGKRTIALVAAAALGLAGGAVLTRALTPSTSANASGATAPVNEGAAQAAVVVNSEYGQARGPVHQDQPLVTTDWLAANLGDPNLVIIEVSEGRDSSQLTRYDQGHIEGAHELVWYRDFVEQLNRDLVSPEEFTALAQSLGINPDSHIVLYGDANNWFASYGAWVFLLYGAEHVSLLDGGRQAWESEGRPLDTVAPTAAAGTWEALAPNSSIRAFQSELLAVVEGEAPGVIIDIRGPAEYNGEIGVAEGFGGEAAAKWGHIPGAINSPWGQIVNQPDAGGDGTFLPVDEIRAHYEALGIDGSEPIYVYCRIGERASHTWYALSQLLGYDVKLYDGSWTEWGNSVGVPVANPTLEASGGFSGLWGGN